MTEHFINLWHRSTSIYKIWESFLPFQKKIVIFIIWNKNHNWKLNTTVVQVELNCNYNTLLFEVTSLKSHIEQQVGQYNYFLLK